MGQDNKLKIHRIWMSQHEKVLTSIMWFHWYVEAKKKMNKKKWKKTHRYREQLMVAIGGVWKFFLKMLTK